MLHYQSFENYWLGTCYRLRSTAGQPVLAVGCAELMRPKGLAGNRAQDREIPGA